MITSDRVARSHYQKDIRVVLRSCMHVLTLDCARLDYRCFQGKTAKVAMTRRAEMTDL